MTRKTLLILNIAAICIISTLLFSFKSTTPTYQHLVIATFGVELQKVCVSIDGKEYIPSTNTYAKQQKGNWDVNPIINLIHQYEAEGWVMQSITGDNTTLYYWLRKEN